MARRHDALIPLSHDHQKALSLAFRLLHPAPPGPVTPTTPESTPPSRRLETLQFFDEHLAEHFAIEEELLFPALRQAYGEGSTERTVVDALCQDHRAMTSARNAIERCIEESELCHLLESFGVLLQRHIRREERELFAIFPGMLEPAAVAELHARIHERRPPDTPGACKL
ncbi:MAG TPA: hemerythrin domain-containing protein [Candidatus Binatia bacterium]|nr:hemerythrin domain-containing protein [Candidatus Binatia bacterium]